MPPEQIVEYPEAQGAFGEDHLLEPEHLEGSGHDRHRAGEDRLAVAFESFEPFECLDRAERG